MTEDEAKQRWCPFARVGSFHGLGGPPQSLTTFEGASMQLHALTANRTGQDAPLDGSHCIASACMAWREDIRMNNSADPDGYCGLAGQPMVPG